MRRALYLAVVCLAALSLPAFAQMRGGGGFRGGFSGGSHGGFQGGFRGGPVINRGFVSRPFHHQRFFSPVAPIFPFGVTGPLWWDDGEAVVEQPQPQPQPQPIVIVVDRDRERSDDPPAAAAQPPLIIERDGDRYVQRGNAQSATPARRPAAPPEPAPPPAIVILRSGQQLEVSDYALTTDTLYDLSGGRTHKIPLSAINLAATHKANEDRGINFSLPACDAGDSSCATVNVY